jgi:hypothetical protein
VSGQLHAPAALPPGKSSRYPLYGRLGGPPRAGLDDMEKWILYWSLSLSSTYCIAHLQYAICICHQECPEILHIHGTLIFLGSFNAKSIPWGRICVCICSVRFTHFKHFNLESGTSAALQVAFCVSEVSVHHEWSVLSDMSGCDRYPVKLDSSSTFRFVSRYPK